MTFTLLHGCCQVETCAADLDVSRGFLVDFLGGVPAEQELARQISELIPGDDYDVDHVDCGQAIFQINRPSPSMTWQGNPSVHQRYLNERGSCVTNLNYFVDDIEHARELLSTLGAETLIEGPSTSARALAEYGADNTRPGGAARPFLFMGTRHLIGFDLEIMEPNFVHFSMQDAQFPAYVQPRPGGNGQGFRLTRLIVAVPDLDRLQANLAAIFSPASVSRPYCRREASDGRSLRLWLGGIELEYVERTGDICSPAPDETGVFAIAFACESTENVVAQCRQAGIETQELTSDMIGLPSGGGAWILASRGRVGFDVVLERETD